jgi:hypothetical protein
VLAVGALIAAALPFSTGRSVEAGAEAGAEAASVSATAAADSRRPVATIDPAPAAA